jgi:hypothetical protein
MFRHSLQMLLASPLGATGECRVGRTEGRTHALARSEAYRLQASRDYLDHAGSDHPGVRVRFSAPEHFLELPAPNEAAGIRAPSNAPARHPRRARPLPDEIPRAEHVDDRAPLCRFAVSVYLILPCSSDSHGRSADKKMDTLDWHPFLFTTV